MTIASVWSALEAKMAGYPDAIGTQRRDVIGRGYAPKQVLLLQPLQARSLWKRSGGNLLHKLLTKSTMYRQAIGCRKFSWSHES